jgi:hypothetical protein
VAPGPALNSIAKPRELPPKIRILDTPLAHFGRFVLSSPIVIHILRPYASEEEYLEHERFSIEAKSMLLIDQPVLPIDTSVVFDVTLDNGQKPIRAEARVVGYVEPEGGRPGGLRVRFRRFGAATKAFIDRAVNGPATASPIELPQAAAPTPSVPAIAAPVLDVAPAPTVTAAAPVFDPPLATTPAPEVSAHSAPQAAPPAAPAPLQANEAHEADEASGIHRKTVAPVPVPANRDALLARLRGRRVG